MKGKRFWNLLSVVALVGCLLCFGFVGWHYWSNEQAAKKYESLRDEVSLEKNTESERKSGNDSESVPESEAVSESAGEETEAPEFVGIIDAPAPEIPQEVLTDAEENPVDFVKLQEINPELYAWIRIPNTSIDYPVAQRQGEDQDFYLHHDMYQESQFAGCIYTEDVNSMDFDDPVTVMYGHNMKNGSMFQNLYYFLNQDFFDQNKYIYVYTPDEILVYEIISIYTYDDRHIMTSFDFSNKKEFKEYLEGCQHPRSMEALVRDEIVLTEKSRILTLSTCIANQTDQRLLVQAVLLNREDEK